MTAGNRVFRLGKRVADEIDARLVPGRLSSRFSSPDPRHSAEIVEVLADRGRGAREPEMKDRLLRDRVHLVPWLDRTRPLEGARILEVGCGLGASTVALAEQGAQLTALDVSPEDLEVARLRVRAHGQSAEFVVANAVEIGEVVGQGEIDWIIFWAVLEHMTVQERLVALDAAWQVLGSGGLLTVVETPNRLWYMDSHTSLLPYFNWLPDELALSYARFSPRPAIRDAFRGAESTSITRFVRRGRAIGFHEFDLSIGRSTELDVVSCLQLERRRRNPLRMLGWRASLAGRYEAILRKVSPGVPRAFLQPFLYLSIAKR